MSMRSQVEIEAMLKKFDEAYEVENLDEDGEGIRDALLWVSGHTSDDTITQSLPD